MPRVLYFIDGLGFSELQNTPILKELDFTFEAGSGVKLLVNKILTDSNNNNDNNNNKNNNNNNYNYYDKNKKTEHNS